MTDYNEDKTVIVDRDTTDRGAPFGWIILLVALLLVAVFIAMGGAQMFGGDTTEDAETQTDDTSSPVDGVTPDQPPAEAPEVDGSVESP